MSETPDRPLVTVAIPTYNSANKYLTNALSSALAQTYDNLEVIVSDNCSSDNTSQVVNNIHDGRLRYIRQIKNIGANGNFNFCLKEAKGDYILFLCDDDLIDPDFISICMGGLSNKNNNGPSFIRTGVRVIDSSGSTLFESKNIVHGKTPEKFFKAWFSKSTSWYLCNTLFKRSALQEIGGLNSLHNVLEDCYAITKLAAKCDWKDIEDIKASFRKYPEQKTFSISIQKWCEDFLGLLDLMCEQVNSDKEEFRAQGKHYFGNLCSNRVRALPTRKERLIAGAVLARNFGLSYFPFKGIFKIRQLVIRSINN